MAEDIAVGEWEENATLRYKDLTDEIKKKVNASFWNGKASYWSNEWD